jgi:2-(1,2-epoxy-1,2-dihydrophenyl)acetyl-CoA isomerase
MRDYPKTVEGLTVDHVDGRLQVRLNRPDRSNALTDEIVLALIDLIEVAGSDESVRVIELRGAGRNFCSGFDLGGRGNDGAAKARAGATQRRLRWHVNRLIPTMLETQTPIVAGVQGWAVGLGMNIALASDFVVAANDARFRAPFNDAGFTPDSGATWMLPRLVGVARAKRVLLLGEVVSGAEAAEWGMIHDAVAPEDLDQSVDALVARLSGSATVSVGLTKLLVHRALTADLARHLEDEAFAIELSSRSEDFAEASRSAREKREPDFKGR